MAGRWHEASAINGMIAVAYAGLRHRAEHSPRLEPAEWMVRDARGWRDLAKLFAAIHRGGTVIFMMSVDMVVVQRYFDKEQTGFTRLPHDWPRADFFRGPDGGGNVPKIVKSHAEQTNRRCASRSCSLACVQ